MAFSSAKCGALLPANTTMQRFDTRFMHVDFPLSSIATIVTNDAAGRGNMDADVNSEFRSNRDIVGLLWTSKDKFGHVMTQYLENRNYSGLRLAFFANPPTPFDFTVTITNSQGSGQVYRLFPHVLSAGAIVPDASDPAGNGVGPGGSYDPAEILPGVSNAQIANYLATGYYLYVMNFDNLRLGFNYDLALVDPTSIQQFFFSLVPHDFGLGYDAKVRTVGAMVGTATPGQVRVLGADRVEYIEIYNVLPQLRLKKGDLIQIVLSVPQDPQASGKSTITYTLKNQTITLYVKEWYGDGTTSRFIKIDEPLEQAAWIGGRASASFLQLDSPLGAVTVPFKIRDLHVSGTGLINIPRRYYPQAAHGMHMTSGLDDTYNITPYRQIDNSYALGYRGPFTMYMGMSHYFKATSYGSAPGVLDSKAFNNKVIKDAAQPLNVPVQAWCANLFYHLHNYGYTFVWSTSYEILNTYMPEEWKQRDFQGKPALSGWSPPSSFVIPAKVEAIDYLARTIKHGLSLMLAAGWTQAECGFQIGEPWWWDGSYNGGAPCIYDDYTKSLYTSETGNAVPLPYYTSFKGLVTTAQRPYLEWLGMKLGNSTNYIRDTVKATYPNTKATLLFFTPQLFDGAQGAGGLPGGVGGPNELRSIINFPTAEWVYPNYDFMQIEDYDWIIDGRLDLLPHTLEAATVTLGYPLAVMHYFVGFVLTPDQTWIWPNINLATKLAKENSIPYIYVWAYPQVIRDAILYDDTVIETHPPIQPDVPLRRQMDQSLLDGKVFRPVMFAQVGPDVFMNSGDRNIVYGGNTWYATGKFGAIDAIAEGLTDTSSGWQMRLSHLPLTEADTISAYVKDAPVSLFLGLMDEANQLVQPPRLFAQGKVNQTDIKIEQAFLVLYLTVRSSLVNWKKANNERYTDELQQMKFPGDRGLKFVNDLAARKILWGDQNGGAA
jgi:hypothetical protein